MLPFRYLPASCCDLRLAGKDSWGTHMVVCTGSKAHVERLIGHSRQNDVKARV
jgi:hypothetical protein